MREWSFLTNHARVLVCIAHDRACASATSRHPGHHERSVFGIVTDLITAGYVTKGKDGRRNRYRDPRPLPLQEPGSRTIDREVLEIPGRLEHAHQGPPGAGCSPQNPEEDKTKEHI